MRCQDQKGINFLIFKALVKEKRSNKPLYIIFHEDSKLDGTWYRLHAITEKGKINTTETPVYETDDLSLYAKAIQHTIKH